MLIVLGLSSVARADVVGPPPASCPAGSEPSASHAGPHCDPGTSCTLSAMCGAGEACEAVGLCIQRVPCGGRLPPDAGPCFEDHVVGNCSAGGTCSTGTCEVRNVCVSPSSGGGCACRAGRGHATLAFVGLLGLAVALAVRRR